MVGNILKIIATLVLGYALGWVIGSISGAFIGAIPALFLREIANSGLDVLPSIFLSLLIGAILGFLATKFSNKIFEASDSSFVGVVIGMVSALVVVFFVDGAFSTSASAVSNRSSYLLALIYSGVIGGDTGTIVFPIIGVIRVIRDIIEAHNEAKSNNARLKEIQTSLGMHSPDKEKSG